MRRDVTLSGRLKKGNIIKTKKNIYTYGFEIEDESGNIHMEYVESENPIVDKELDRLHDELLETVKLL